jgi:hypothetical protein
MQTHRLETAYIKLDLAQLHVHDRVLVFVFAHPADERRAENVSQRKLIFTGARHSTVIAGSR